MNKQRWRMVGLLVTLGAVTPLAQGEPAPEQQRPTEFESDYYEELITLDERPAPTSPVLESITVFGQREGLAVELGPQSVIGLDAGALAAADLRNPQALNDFVPNLNATITPPFSKIRLRGIGTGFDKGFEPSTGIFLDGVHVGRLSFMDMAFLDVAQVRVLRGPQGTRMGRSTIAGAILIDSVQPGTEWDLDAGLTLGRGEDRRGVFRGNAPLGRFGALRLAAQQEDYAGHVHNTALDRLENGRDSRSARLSYRVEAAPGWELGASLTHLDQTLSVGNYELSTVTDEQRQQMEAYDPDFETRLGNWQSSQDTPSFALQQGDKLDLRTTSTVGALDVRVMASSVALTENTQRDIDFSPIPQTVGITADVYRLRSVELRLGTAAARRETGFHFELGLYAADASTYTRFDLLLGGAPPDPALPVALPDDFNGQQVLEQAGGTVRQRERNHALFGAFGWRPWPRFELSAGLRWSADKKAALSEAVASTAGAPITGPLARQIFEFEPYVAQRARRDDRLTGRLGLAFDVATGAQLFASYAQGFKPGGYSGTAVREERLEAGPESSDNFEFGAHYQALAGRLRARLAAFRTDFRNMQQNIFSGGTFHVINAPGARVQGLECDAELADLRGFRLGLNLALLDTAFTDFRDGPCIAGQSGRCDQTGKPLADAPRFKSRFSLDYGRALYGGWRASAGIDWIRSSARYHQVDHDPLDRRPGYDMIHARVALQPRHARWQLQLLGRNLGNAVATVGSLDVPGMTGAHFANLQPPQELRLRLDITL